MINPRTKLNGNLDEFSKGATSLVIIWKNNNSNNAFKRILLSVRWHTRCKFNNTPVKQVL